MRGRKRKGSNKKEKKGKRMKDEEKGGHLGQTGFILFIMIMGIG